MNIKIKHSKISGRKIIVSILLLSLYSTSFIIFSEPYYSSPTILLVNNDVIGLLPIMKLSNYSVITFSNKCKYGYMAFGIKEKHIILNMTSSINILLYLISNMHIPPEKIFISNSSCPISTYYLAGLTGSLIVNIGNNISYSDFIRELNQHRVTGVRPCSAIENVTEIKNKKRLVVAFKGDSLSRLAAVYAGISSARFLIVENLDSVRKAVREYNIKSIIYVISSKNLIKMGLEMLYKPIIEAYSDRFFHASVGIISGYSDSCAINFASRSLYYLAKGVEIKSALLAYMEDAELLAEKILRELNRSSVGVYHKLVSYDEKGNLTKESLINSLHRTSGIVFINLHGNPYGMARTTTGPYVVTAHSLKQVNSGNIIVTLSCSTCNFKEMFNPENSIALAFVSKGALAYLGARKVEYAGEFETSTAFPDLIIYMLLRGYSLGMAVEWVNNIHIQSAKNVDPWIAAYTCLLGDPDINISNLTWRNNDAVIKFDGKEIRVNILRETCCVVSKIEFPYAAEGVKFETKNPDVRRITFITKRDGKHILNMFLTKKISKEVGDFKPGDIVVIKVYKKLSLFDLLPYAITVFIACLAAILYIKRRKRKILRPNSP